MSTLKTNTLDTPSGSGNITFSRPTVLQAGDIITADIADNAITLAKMAGGTDGNIISYDASGDPVAVVTGSSGQVLTSAGAGAPPTFAASSSVTDSKFLAKITSTQSNKTGDGTVYAITGAIWTEVYDTGSDFSNGTFTAPETGKYALGYLIQFDGLGSNHTFVGINIITSNRSFFTVDKYAHNLTHSSRLQVRTTGNIICDMDASDTASLSIEISATDKSVDIQPDTSFWGVLLA